VMDTIKCPKIVNLCEVAPLNLCIAYGQLGISCIPKVVDHVKSHEGPFKKLFVMHKTTRCL
jgi:hypothetical protein